MTHSARAHTRTHKHTSARSPGSGASACTETALWIVACVHGSAMPWLCVVWCLPHRLEQEKMRQELTALQRLLESKEKRISELQSGSGQVRTRHVLHAHTPCRPFCTHAA